MSYRRTPLREIYASMLMSSFNLDEEKALKAADAYIAYIAENGHLTTSEEAQRAAAFIKAAIAQ